MNENTFVVAEIAELMRLDFVLFGLVVIYIPLAGTGTPRAFYYALFTQKIGGLHGIGFIGRAENHPVAEI